MQRARRRTGGGTTGRFATRTSAREGPPAGAAAPRARRPRWLDTALLLAVAALVVAAIVNVVQHGVHGAETPKASPAPVQPDVTTPSPERDVSVASLPARVALPAELRAEGGTLWWSTADCRAGWLDVGLGRTHAVPGRHCRVWPAPTGFRAVLTTGRPSDTPDARGLVMVSRAGGEQTVAHAHGVIAGDLSWSPDGAVASACIVTPAGSVLELLYPYRPRDIRGACQPAWTRAGLLVASVPSPPHVVVGRRTVLTPAQAASWLTGASHGARQVISAVAAAGDRVVVAVTAPEADRTPSASVIAVLTSAGKVVYRLSLGPVVPSSVGIAPDGSAIWYRDAVTGTASLVSVGDGRRLPPIAAERYAWSRHGRYLAAATASGVLVSTWPDGRYVATIPIPAADLSWTGPG